jgi:colicin import membrane protein
VADVVDSIVSQLQVQLDNYRKGYLEAIDLNKQLDKAEADLAAKGKARASSTGSSVAARKKAAQDGAQAEEQADQRVTRSRKKRTDDEIAAAERSKIAEKDRVNAIKQSVRDEAAAVKAAEKEKQAAIAETAKARSAAERSASRTGPAPIIITGGTGQNADHGPRSEPVTPGRPLTDAEARRLAAVQRTSTVPRTPNLESDVSLATEKDINNALIQRVELQERLKVANEQDAIAIRAQMTEINLATTYERAGLEAKEAATGGGASGMEAAIFVAGALLALGATCETGGGAAPC